MLPRHVLWQFEDAPGRQHYLLCETAGSDSDHVAANPEADYAGANRIDDAAELVAQDHGRTFPKREIAIDTVDFGKTYAAGMHCQTDLVRTRLFACSAFDAELSSAQPHCASHLSFFLHPTIESQQSPGFAVLTKTVFTRRPRS